MCGWWRTVPVYTVVSPNVSEATTGKEHVRLL